MKKGKTKIGKSVEIEKKILDLESKYLQRIRVFGIIYDSLVLEWVKHKPTKTFREWYNAFCKLDQSIKLDAIINRLDQIERRLRE